MKTIGDTHIPEYITIQIEDSWPRNLKLLKRINEKTGTRSWEAFTKMEICGEKVTVHFRAYVNNSRRERTRPRWFKVDDSINKE